MSPQKKRGPGSQECRLGGRSEKGFKKKKVLEVEMAFCILVGGNAPQHGGKAWNHLPEVNAYVVGRGGKTNFGGNHGRTKKRTVDTSPGGA